MIRLTLSCALLVALSAQCSLAVAAEELLELTDKQQASLGLELSKAIGHIQQAFEGSFRFRSVQEVNRFLLYCEVASYATSTAQDSSYDGLGARIKAVMAIPDIASACSVDMKAIKRANFDDLDLIKVEDFDYLSKKALENLVTFEKVLGSDASMKLILNHVLQKVISSMSYALLTQAASDIEAFFGQTASQGMFDFDIKYKAMCEISLISPICKLALKNSDSKYAASGHDLANLSEVIKHKGDSLVEHEAMSGVTLDEAKESCEAMKDRIGSYFKPIEQIERYVEAGYVSEKQHEDQLRLDKSLHFYTQLRDTCNQITNS